MSKLTVIDNETGLNELRTYLADKKFVSFDTETTGLARQDRVIGFSICADEEQAFYVITEKFQNGQLSQVFPTHIIADFLNCLIGKNLICHNATFDCIMVESNYGVKLIESIHTDTMILAHLLNENRRVGLKELGTEYFGEDAADEARVMKESVLKNGGKLTKSQYEMWKCDSYIMARYGAKDALLTYKLFYELVPELYAQGLDQFFYEDESMPLLRGPTYELNATGLQVDTSRLQTLKKTLEAECAEAKAFIYKEIQYLIKDQYPGTNKKNTFSITSGNQMAWLLFERMGLEFHRLTDSGKELNKWLGMDRLPYSFSAKAEFIHYSRKAFGQPWKGKQKVRNPWCYLCTDKETLKKYSKKYKWIETLLDYNHKMKILSTYVEGIEERLQYGIIRPSFLQHGTTSGRYSSRSPNFQNLPRDDKRVKGCIIPRQGRVFVGADYSQLEPRVFAYYSNDERLLKAFLGQDDFYSVIGMEVYGKTDCIPRKEGSPEAFGVKYKKLRDLSKVIALASTYGATAHQLAPTTGKSIDETQQDIDDYFERFPGVRSMMTEAHEIAKRDGQVTNLFGRPRRMPEAKKINKLYGKVSHEKLPYQVRNTLNLAVNHRIQSTGASIVNRSAIRFFMLARSAAIECRLVLQVHDSLVIECLEKDRERVAEFLKDAMENTVDLKTIRLEAEPKIGYSLAEV